VTDATLPEALVEIREEFLALDVRNRLQLLLEVSNELPEPATRTTPTCSNGWSSASPRCSCSSR
jgi:sulfur transfer protein SufE